ncbi:putative Ig domain-containing protein [Piscinibacter sakaiensis]|uniref:putative Ig domain-containing protein n=1 Tax=Piscinibacter sakaiensis TaxID=1547922 RepID=UPI003AAD3A34
MMRPEALLLRRPIAEAMEERILHSADLSPLSLLPLAAGEPVQHHQSLLAESSSAARHTQEIVFVDSDLSGIDQLLLDLQTQRSAGRPIEIVLIGAEQDGIALISQTLAGRSDIGAVHVLAHGSDGVLQLGSSRLDETSLLSRAAEIGGWGSALTADADLLLYGCDVAQTALGEAFVRDLALLTGADVAASADLTGAAALGGNWTLEKQTGRIEAAGIADGWIASNWYGVLATYIADPTKADGAVGSLRWALSQANANAGADTIYLLAGTHTLTLVGAGEDFNVSGDLDIRDTVTIVGGSANAADTVVRSTVSDRVFALLLGDATLSNLTVSGGSGGQQGGGISTSNFTSLTLNNVVVSGNSGNNGGGIYAFGSLTMSETRITANTATGIGGGVVVRGITSLNDVEISGNSGTSGGGLYLFSAGTNVTIDRATISGNTANVGAGIYASNGGLAATNLTLSGNTASGLGGGIYINVGSYSFTDSTIANNSGVSGAGIGNGIATLKNTIVASNTGGNASFQQTSAGWNIDTDGSAIVNGGTNRVVTAAALKLGLLADYGGFTKTHMLLNGSVAINTGNPGAAATDQRGIGRIGTPDVGAFEADGKLIVTTTNDVVDGATSSISALLANMGADGRISLREAIIAANNTPGADVITLPGGSYVLTIAGNDNTAAAGDLDITDALTIIGAGARTTTVSNGIDRAFDIRGAAVTISGVTVTGSTGGDGGAFLVSGGGASLTLRDSAISSSTAGGSGGGIHLTGTLMLDRVTIDGNAANGGTGTDGGGGLYVTAGSTATLTNVTLNANTANRGGGAISSRGTVNLVNSTVAGNTGPGAGGIDRAQGTVTLLNTILANNTGGNASGTLTSLGYNIDSGNTAGLTGTGDRINTNPLLGALQFNSGQIKTMAIGAGSAAIDGGTTTGAPGVDARGFARVVNDIGAYERNSLVVDTFSDIVDGATGSIDALLGNRGADGRISLREAVIAANNTVGIDDIVLPAGTYSLSLPGIEDFAAAGDLDLRDSVRIAGAGAATTVISGGGSHAVLQVISGTATISGVTLADGWSSTTGSGITINAGATLNMSQAIVRNNSSSDNGGSITTSGTTTLTDVEVRDNSTSKDGGGIFQAGGTLTLNRVTLANNTGAKGGGLQTAAGTLSMTNVTVSNNTGTNKGGGLALYGGTATLLNVTIADNWSTQGGGLDFDSLLPAGSITIRNTLFANNTGGHLGKDDSNLVAVTSLGNNLSTGNSPELSHASDKKNAVANLGALGNWGGFTRTRPLLAGSAAINAGDNASAPSTDQRGSVRVGVADIGAYEFGGAANSAPVLDAAKSPVLATIAANAPAPVGAVGTLVSALVDLTNPAGGLDNVTDADLGALTGLAVIGIDTTNGSAFWSTDDGATWTAFGSVSPSAGLLLAADTQTRIYYRPNPVFTGTLGSALTIRAWDRSSGTAGTTADTTVNGGATAFSTATDTVALTVAAPPVVVTSSSTLAYLENAAPTPVDAALAVSDADSANLVSATVSISANYIAGQDVLGFVDQLGISGSWDAATGVLSLSGSASVASYQIALRSVTFANSSENPSTLQRSVSFVVNDGSLSNAPALRSIAVSAVNDAPSGTNATIAVAKNGSRVLVRADFGFADAAGEANNFTSVLVQLPSAGTLKLGGTTLTGATEVTVAQLDAGALVYSPVPGAAGNGYATIGFQVRDDGGTANGGIDLDPVQRTLTVDVINAAPVITSNGGGASAALAVPENSTAVTTVTATDADGDAILYSIAGGADAARFSINGTTGELRFVSAPNFELPTDVGADNVYNVTVRAADPAGGVVTQAIAVTVTDVLGAPGAATATLMFSTASAQSPAAGGKTWTTTDLLQYGNLGDRFDLDGGLTTGTVDLLPGFVAPKTVRGMHYVQTAITIGSGLGVKFNLSPGDLLLVLDPSPDPSVSLNLGALIVDRKDIVVFRPTVAGNYASGTYSMLLNDGVKNGLTSYNVHGLTLVETDTMVGGVLLPAGTFVVAHSTPALHANVYTFTASSTGSLTTSTSNTSLLIDGSKIGVTSDKISGLHLLSAPTAFNDAVLPAGTLLMAVDGGSHVIGGVAQTAVDIVALSFTRTEQNGGTIGNGQMLFDGSDLGVTAELNGFTVIAGNVTNSAPTVANPIASHSTNEDALYSFTFAANTFADADAGDVLSYSATLLNGAALPGWLAFNAGTRSFSGTPTNGEVGSLQLRVTATDPSGAKATSDFTLTIDNVNDAPVLDGSENLPAIGEDPATNPGASVTSLLPGHVSDVDAAALSGIAVIAVDNANGAWQYSTNGGSSWNPFGSVSAGTARLLASDASTRIRFVPNANWNGASTIQFRAWDQTSGSAGGTANITVTGGTSAFSTATAVAGITVTPVNDAPTGLPLISGSATEDQLLSADVSGIADVDGLGAFSYQWLRNGSAIAGATATTLLLGDADVGKTITVRVSYTDGGGTLETQTSAATAPVANINDAPTGLPTISGSAVEDQLLTAVVSGIADADGLGAFSYQWQRNGSDIAGATGSTLLLGDADVGNTISVRVGYTDGHGTLETLTSTATGPVANVNDDPTGLPVIGGSVVEGQTLTADASGIVDDDGLGAFSVQWQRNGSDIAGATGSSLLLGNADVGKIITVRVSYVDGFGTLESVTSALTDPVANVNDDPTGLPVISGSAVEHQTLTADVSGIADGDGLGAFSYQWQRDGSDIAGATGSSLLLGNADIGKAISVRISYVDGFGTLETLTSAATGLVANVNDAPTGLPTIGGSAAEYQTLSANVSAIADNDGLGSFSYQWLRNGSDIAGATGSTLLLGSADIGKTISLRVSYVDGFGTLETLNSAAVGPVANVNDAPTGVPTISGSALEGQTLVADASGIGDLDGLGAFSVQWLRNGSPIAGATGTSWLLGNADVGKTISVRVSYTDGHGTLETVTSAVTDPITNVNNAPTGLPVISGSAVEDRLLTADVSAIADGDGLGVFSYQWLRNGGVIAGATATTLLLGDADVGQTISVRVSYVDGNGTLETLTSAAVGPIQNINDAPRGSDATLSVNRNGSRTLTVADFGFADFAGESNAFKSVLLQLPSAGTLRLGGTVLGAATEVTRAQLDAGDVVYAPAFGGSGNAYATLKFQVRDDGGTANGGVDLDPVQRTLTFDVLNKAPVITSDGGGATAALAIQENRSTVTTVQATDADLDTLVYSIIGGADAARFRIDAATGVLSFVVPPNFELPADVGADNVFNVTVRVSDGVAAATQALAISVLDVQEAIQNSFEQRVNSSLSNDQRTSADNRGSHRAVAIAPNGNYVVVWSSKDQDGSGWGVYGQRFDLSGAALGGEFRINQTTSGDQRWASVVNDLDGNFVVAWTNTVSSGDRDVMIRRYAADGSALGGELRVNTTTSAYQDNASIAIDANGNVIVVWQGNGPGDSDGIFGRRFAADGSAIDANEFRINTDLTRSQTDASVAMNASGAFAVVWDNSTGVQLRLYSATGTPLTGQIGVASGSDARDAAVALADDGTAIVVWRDIVADKGVYLQRYSSAGATIGSTIVVNTTTSGDQTDPSVAVDGSGNFIVVWEGRGPGDDSGVFGQKFTAAGVRVGGEFRINQTTKDDQDRASVAMLDLNNFVVVWTSDADGSLDDEVMLRQYGSLNTAPLLSGINNLPTIGEDPLSNPGMLVSDLLAGRISDPDPAGTSGIAVIGVDDGNGSWQYSSNGGVSWTAFGAVSDSSARLLASDSLTRVRFVPNPDWNGSVVAGLTVRAWDRSSGSAGGTADVRSNGGQTAFGSATASSRITVTPVNDLPTGLPLVSGSAIEDQLLSVVTSGIADADGLGSFSYQWLRNGVAIGGATASTLLLGDADVGKLISVRVSWLDGGGTLETLTSAQTAPVVNVNDVPTGAPLIVGSAVEDAVLSVVTGSIADADGLGAFSYQWQRNGVAIAGATGTSLLLGDADVGRQISVRVSWIDGHGTAEALTSAPTAPVVNINDMPTGAPVINGSAVEDQTLTANVAAIADADGLGIFSYQWQRDGIAIGGATGSSHVLGDADVGKRISVRVSWIDGHGTAEALTSAQTAKVANVNDVPVGLPLIVGSVTEDQTLSVDTSGISDDDGLGLFSVQWQRDGVAIAGATGSTLLLGDADVGARISVRISYVDGHGTAESLTSASTAPVANVNDAPQLNRPIADQRAIVGTTFSKTLPADTFTDVDPGEVLAWSVTTASGDPLPAWLVFDPTTRTLSGTPARADLGAMMLRASATDLAGATASDLFRFDVVLTNVAPQLANPIADQAVQEGSAWHWNVPASTFSDSDVDDELTIEAALASGAAWPAWLSFDPATQTFSGTPANGDVGALQIRLTARDLVGAEAANEFRLVVLNINDAPTAVRAIADQRVEQDRPFALTVDADSFSDPDVGDSLRFSAALASGAALPSWLVFDPANRSFSGTPGNADVGELTIRIIATDDAGESAFIDFRLTVDNVNDAPVRTAALTDRIATEGQPFAFAIPADTFVDIDAGDLLSLHATLASGAALPAWLVFDPSTGRFAGTPGNGDVGSLVIRITATDRAGASASGDFRLDVINVNDAPSLSGVNDLASVLEDSRNHPGTLVADLIAGHFSDVDAVSGRGIAVTALDASHGSWQFTLDGKNWTDFGPVNEQTARLLAADATTAIRFVPNERWFGRVADGLTLRGWDQSSGSAGQTADVRVHGGSSAFSSQAVRAGVTVVHVNHAPEAKAITDQAAVEARSWQFTLPPATFVDSDAGDVLTYRATLLNGSPLPAWLKFDPATLTFKGSPESADIGSMTIRVIATDGNGAAAQSIFVLTVLRAPEPQTGAVVDSPPPVLVPTEQQAEAAAVEKTLVATDAPAAPQSAGSNGDDVLAGAGLLNVSGSGIVVNLAEPVVPSGSGSRSDEILAALPVAQFNALTVHSMSQLLTSEDLLRKFDDLKHQMQDIGEQQRQMIASSLAISSGLSLGYVVWLVRGGVLLSSMLSALPAWQMIDPMPVLAAAGAAKTKGGKRWFGGRDVDTDDRDVEKLFDAQARDSIPPAPVTASATTPAATHGTEVRS